MTAPSPPGDPGEGHGVSSAGSNQGDSHLQMVSSCLGYAASHCLRAACMGVAPWCYMLGRSCARQIFTHRDDMAFKQLHYHPYTAQVWCAEWYYLWAASSCTATVGKLLPSPSSWGEEWVSCTGDDKGRVSKHGCRRCSEVRYDPTALHLGYRWS